MKKVFTLLSILTAGIAVNAQTNTVHGTITDCAGAPVVGHLVYITVDSNFLAGTGYFNTVYTDITGFYNDPAVPYMGGGLPEAIHIGTNDPTPGVGYYSATETPSAGGNTYTHDFSVACASSSSTVHGTVTDCMGAPVVGHPVYIAVDSTLMGGSGYTNTVYTNASGFYEDPAVPYTGGGLPEAIYIGTNDPAPGVGYYYATETPTAGGNTYTHDFSVDCASSSSCAVSFVPYQDSTGTNDTLYLVVNYTSATPSATTFAWDYGDGSTGTGLYTTHLYSASGTFTVCVTLTDSSVPCADTFCQNINYVMRSGFVLKTVSAIPMAVKEIENKYTFNVYPNPAENLVTIASTDLNVVNSISIYDMTGREVFTQQNNNAQNNLQLNIQGLEKGSYTMVLKNAEKLPVHTHTLIKH